MIHGVDKRRNLIHTHTQPYGILTILTISTAFESDFNVISRGIVIYVLSPL